MNNIEVLEALFNYIDKWRELELEYYKIPSWRWLKQLQNIRQREMLTRVFVAQMKHRGVIQ